jgi:hypothetical protein
VHEINLMLIDFQFQDSLDEMDDSRDVIQSLVDEYTAATKSDYLNWGINRHGTGLTTSASQVAA